MGGRHTGTPDTYLPVHVKPWRHRAIEVVEDIGDQGDGGSILRDENQAVVRGKHKGLEAFFRRGTRAGIQFHSISVNGNWRVVFRFIEQDVELVDYLDYH